MIDYLIRDHLERGWCRMPEQLIQMSLVQDSFEVSQDSSFSIMGLNVLTLTEYIAFSKSWRICLDTFCLIFQSLLYLLLFTWVSKSGWVDFLELEFTRCQICKTCENLSTRWSAANHHNSWGKSLSCKINYKPGFLIIWSWMFCKEHIFQYHCPVILGTPFFSLRL